MLFYKKLNASDLERLAKKGNKKARKILEETGYYLGIGLANIVNSLNPEIIILFGGVSEGGKILLDSAKKVMKKRTILHPPEVVWSRLKHGGILGAASLILK